MKTLFIRLLFSLLGGTAKRKGIKTGNVSALIKRGLCLTHVGEVIRIPSDTRIGMPMEDRALSSEEVSKLIAAVEPGNLRDRLLLSLMFRTGARISQVLDIRYNDIDWIQSRIYVRPAKEGDAFWRTLDSMFLEELKAYCRTYHMSQSSPLFSVIYPSVEHWGYWPRRTKHPISRRVADYIIHKYATQAGIQYQYVNTHTGELHYRIHCHTSKYTYVSWALQALPRYSTLLVACALVGNRNKENFIRAYGWPSREDLREVSDKVLDRFVQMNDYAVTIKKI
jgi:integrase